MNLYVVLRLKQLIGWIIKDYKEMKDKCFLIVLIVN